MTSSGSAVRVGNIAVANDLPITLIGGLNVLVDPEETFSVASALVRLTRELGIELVFKASFDKANRSSIRSYRGPGMNQGLAMLAEVKRKLAVPVTTDVHEPDQCDQVAEVADLLQIPAFLSRQTDLIAAAATTGKPLHVKKMQMSGPVDATNVVSKCHELGATGVIVGERGTTFGYGNLVVDMLTFRTLKDLGCPVVFDVTHALQLPGGRGESSAGRGNRATDLAIAAATQGLAALFLEVHPDPVEARCDGECATPLDAAEGLLRRVTLVDALVKSTSFTNMGPK
jgi:2-dehydro-3-deoxyphosphooctonate aldolase (KDO 8-P synthase)